MKKLDVHTELAAKMFNVAPDAVTPQMRNAAKNLNYIYLYTPTSPQPAPDVQGEPVTWKESAANWLREKAAEQQALNEQYPEHTKCYPTWENLVLKLSWLAGELSEGVAPQPAEQQPDPTDEQILAITTAYEQGVGKGQEALCRGEEIRNPYSSSWGCDKAWQLGYEVGKSSGTESSVVKPQPEQDVSDLVGALEWLRGAINATPENDKVQAGTWISTKHPRIKQIDAILAAHRKGDSK